MYVVHRACCSSNVVELFALSSIENIYTFYIIMAEVSVSSTCMCFSHARRMSSPIIIAGRRHYKQRPNPDYNLSVPTVRVPKMMELVEEVTVSAREVYGRNW